MLPPTLQYIVIVQKERETLEEWNWSRTRAWLLGRDSSPAQRMWFVGFVCRTMPFKYSWSVQGYVTTPSGCVWRWLLPYSIFTVWTIVCIQHTSFDVQVNIHELQFTLGCSYVSVAHFKTVQHFITQIPHRYLSNAWQLTTVKLCTISKHNVWENNANPTVKKL